MEQTATSLTAREVPQDEAELHEFMEQFAAAVATGNLDELMSFYDEDVVAFDMMPPLAWSGKAKYRGNWKGFTDYFKFPVNFDFEEQKICVSGDVAFVHGLIRMGADPKDGGPRMDSWMRNTVGLRKTDGEWRIVHDHYSVPISSEDGMGLMNLTPVPREH